MRTFTGLSALRFGWLLSLAATSACTSVLERNKSAQLNISISNKVKSSGKALTAQSVIYPTDVCYAVHVTGPHPLLRRQAPDADQASCPANQGGLGLLVGFFGPGSSVSLDLPVGPQRQIDLVAVKKSVLGGSCPQGLHGEVAGPPNTPYNVKLFVGNTELPDNLPMTLLARNTVNVTPGANDITLTPFINPNDGTHGMEYGCHGNGGPGGLATWPWIDEMDNSLRTGMNPMFLEVACIPGAANNRLTVPGVGVSSLPCSGAHTVFHNIAHTATSSPQSGWKIEALDSGDAVLESKEFSVTHSPAPGAGNQYRVMEQSTSGPFERTMASGPLRINLVGWDQSNKRVFVNANHSGGAISAGNYSFVDALSVTESAGWYQNINAAYDTIYPSSTTAQLSATSGSFHSSGLLQGLIMYNTQATSEFIKGLGFASSFLFGSLVALDGPPPAPPTSQIPLSAADGDFQVHIRESSGWFLTHNYYNASGSGGPTDWGSQSLSSGSSYAYQLFADAPPSGTAFIVARTDATSGNNLKVFSCLDKTYCGHASNTYSQAMGTSDTRAVLLNPTGGPGNKDLIHFYGDGGSPEFLTAEILHLTHSATPASAYSPVLNPVFYPGWRTPIVKFAKVIKANSTYGQDLLIGGMDHDGTDYHSVIYRSRDAGRTWYRVYYSVIPNMMDYVQDAIEIQAAYTDTSNSPPTLGYYPAYMLVELANSGAKYRILMQDGHGF